MFSTGFQPLYMKMKYFKLEKSLLWPRFHVDVTESLRRQISLTKGTKKANQVTEVRVKLSDYMEKIQNALMASIEALIGELKRNNPDLVSEYWAIENALDKNFVQSIRLNLDPVWHRISFTTKQILSDLTALKEFLLKLFKWDSVQFYQLIIEFVEENKPSGLNNRQNSLWMMLDEASAVIACAKERIFKKIEEKIDNTEDVETTFLLEELPKWEQLALILDEINENKLSRDNSNDGPTVIVCHDKSTCVQLRRFLSFCKQYKLKNGSKVFSVRKMMVDELKQHIFWKKTNGQRRTFIQIKLKATEEAEKKEENKELNISKTFLRNRQPITKRRRARGGSVVVSHGRLMNKSDQSEENLNTAEQVTELLESQLEDDSDSELHFADVEVEQDKYFMNDFDMNADSLDENKPFRQIACKFLERSDEIIIGCFKSIDLEELMPSFIISYEPNLAYIRKVELYQTITCYARCYFMYYGGSIEEQMYLNEIKHEKDAFTKLIREKANLPKFFSTDDDEVAKFDSGSHQNTRIAGGGLCVTSKRKIIVDMREFRSQLPFLCYLADLEVIPCMLTVGDYILTPKICVERKSVPDLIGSLKSGRLYQQCEQMFKYYELVTLLIEFEEGKSFSFQPFTAGFLTNTLNNNVTGNTNMQDIQLKLMILLSSFPKINIVWSSSPFETARLFKELKANQEEPDVQVAINAGLDPLFEPQTAYNDMAIDMIQKIPGVNSVNYHLIVSKVKSMFELSKMNSEQLSEIVGIEAANKIVGFFNRKV